MNLLIISGRLGQDAETRYTANGKAVASFSVAVDSGFGDKKKTNWFKCSLWGKRAEGGLVPYLTKGTQVTVTGEVSLNTWDNNGKTGASLDVFVDKIELGAKGESQQPRDYPQEEPKTENNTAGDDDKFFDDLSDVPF